MSQGIGVSNFFSLFTNYNGLELTPLLSHSLDVAKISVALASKIADFKFNKTDLYISGLFHDLGLFVQNITKNILEINNIDSNKYDKSVYSFDMLGIIENADKKLLHPWISANILHHLDLNIDKEYIDAVRMGHSTHKEILLLTKRQRILTEIIACADNTSIIFRNKIINGSEISYKHICENLNNEKFSKDIQEALKEVFNDSFTLNMLFDNHLNLDEFYDNDIKLDIEQIIKISKLMAFFIDHRSPYTRNHTTYVAELSKILAEEILTPHDGHLMYMAGMLHDIGKLKTPLQILHKKGKLDTYEMMKMKDHIMETYNFFKPIKELSFIGRIAYSHHERLDGSGYPFKKDKNTLNIHQRIIAVSDVYSALIEERPYRKALEPDTALKIIEREVKHGKLDGDVLLKLSTLIKNGFVIPNSNNILDYFFDIED